MQPELLKGEISHSEITKYIYDKLKHIWKPYLKSDVLCLGVVNARLALEMQKMTSLGIKECLTEAILGWKGFGLYNENREFYTFNKKYVRDYIRKYVKGGRVCAFNRYFE